MKNPVSCSYPVLADAIGNTAPLPARVRVDDAKSGRLEHRLGAFPALNVLFPFPVESGFVSVELRHRYAPPWPRRHGVCPELAAYTCEALLDPVKDLVL